MVQAQALAKLRQAFTGTIIMPGDKAYDTAKTTFVVKDARPAIITKAKSNQDIAAAIEFAKTAGLDISVRSGGHHAAGFGTNNGGLVLDLSFMNTIEILDEKAGLVRLGSGALWGDVAVALAKHGLAISSGDTKTVAVGGLTLGGGIGWMVRKYGYAIDSLVAAEVVLADGSVVRASESEYADLFWAVRGGGGNFGVVSNFEFKAHPQGKIVESILVYGAEDIQNAIAGWRDHMRQAPEDLTSFMTLFPPDFIGPAPQIMIMNCYAEGDLPRANAALEPLRHLGNMLNETTAVKDYADMLQEAHPPEGLRFVVKNMFAKIFSDRLVAALQEVCCKPGSPVVQLRAMHGAVDKVDPDATAMAHRKNEIFFFAGFGMPMDTTAEQETRLPGAWDTLASYSSGTYSNFLSTNTRADVAAIYPEPTYQRLAKIKRQYDPQNIFKNNFNILPE